jgi:hydrogenase maturation protease
LEDIDGKKTNKVSKISNQNKQVKIFFMGNRIAGDDGIGPYVYDLLRKNHKLKEFQMMEAGVIGLDLISHVQGNEKVIIVDAVLSEKEIGKVSVFKEDELSNLKGIVSQHDIGVEQTAVIMRSMHPNLDNISIIGINVDKNNLSGQNISSLINGMMKRIEENVIESIFKVVNDNN